jgi:hypothetical protein
MLDWPFAICMTGFQLTQVQLSKSNDVFFVEKKIYVVRIKLDLVLTHVGIVYFVLESLFLM